MLLQTIRLEITILDINFNSGAVSCQWNVTFITLDPKDIFATWQFEIKFVWGRRIGQSYAKWHRQNTNTFSTEFFFSYYKKDIVAV